MGKFRVIISGGRDFGLIKDRNDPEDVQRAEDDKRMFRDTMETCVPADALIIEGGATGADALAKAWAIHNGVEYLTFYAMWNVHGKAAGPRRNQRALDEGKPDLVIAFPGGAGTAHMVKIAKAAGIPVIEPKRNEISLFFS